MDTERDQTATAKERADAIRRGIDATADAMEQIPRLVIEAHDAEDWRTLGHESWPDYIQNEFGTSLLKLDKATRKTWTRRLRDAGMSTREIAPVTNSSQPTVVRDLRDSDESLGQTIYAIGANPADKLWKEACSANKSLAKVLRLLKEGTEVRGLTQESLRLTVTIVNEIIDIGEKREAR